MLEVMHQRSKLVKSRYLLLTSCVCQIKVCVMNTDRKTYICTVLSEQRVNFAANLDVGLACINVVVYHFLWSLSNWKTLTVIRVKVEIGYRNRGLLLLKVHTLATNNGIKA